MLQEKPHERFTRDGDNLIHKRQITLSEALLGARFTVQTLDDRMLNIDTTGEVMSPTSRKVIRGEGMPNKNDPAHRGDLIIQFDIAFPSRLNELQLQKIREAHLD